MMWQANPEPLDMAWISDRPGGEAEKLRMIYWARVRLEECGFRADDAPDEAIWGLLASLSFAAYRKARGRMPSLAFEEWEARFGQADVVHLWARGDLSFAELGRDLSRSFRETLGTGDPG